jgi:hypothetical protein
LMTELFQLEALAKPELNTEFIGRQALQAFVRNLLQPIAL